MMWIDNPIGFFNWGVGSGASQPHKHMQAISENSFEATGGMSPLTVAINKTFKK